MTAGAFEKEFSMRKKWFAGLLAAAALAGWTAPASAAYERSFMSRSEDASESRGGWNAVDLGRFRKGNPDWDTQELAASGFTALHEEHLQILKDIRELKSAIERLEAKK